MLHRLSLLIKDGDDYTSTSLLLAFHIGSSVGTQQCGDFDLEDDSDQEDEETFTVELTVTDLAVLIASGRESTTMHITDDDGKFLFADCITWVVVLTPS